MSRQLVFIESDYNYPVALLDDIHIYFAHYKSQEEAKNAWERRKTRIIWDKTYVIMYEDEITRDEILQLKNVECKKLIVLTSQIDNLDIPYVKYIEKDKHGRENDYVFLDSDFLGRMTFEKHWDYIEWLNE